MLRTLCPPRRPHCQLFTPVRLSVNLEWLRESFPRIQLAAEGVSKVPYGYVHLRPSRHAVGQSRRYWHAAALLQCSSAADTDYRYDQLPPGYDHSASAGV